MIFSFLVSLRKVLVLLTEAIAALKKVKQTMDEKDFAAFDEAIAILDILGGQIIEAEQERLSCYKALLGMFNLPEDISFYKFSEILPEDSRKEALDLYRNLKLTITRIQGLSIGLSAQSHRIEAGVKQMLEALYPHRRGTVYGRTGVKRHADDHPMMVDRQL
jgi:hypothetical protein